MARGATSLLVGASGFLGPWLAVEAARDGRLPLVAGRRPADEIPSELARRLAASGALARLDASDAAAVEGLLDSVRPSAVLVSAALSRIAACAADTALAARLNVELPERCARWCARHGARIVLVSTDLVFGGAGAPAAGFDEDAPTAPLHVYGASKAAGEQALLASGARALVVRLPLLFGPSGSRALGASDALVAAVLRGERPALFTDEWRTPLDVRDASRALIECLEGERTGILHVAGPARFSRHELGLAVLRAHGLDDERARAAVRATTRAAAGCDAERAADVSLDAARARAVLATRLRGVAEALHDGLA